MNLLQYLSIRKLKPLVKLVDAKWHYRKKLCKVPTAQSHMLDLGVHLVMSPRMLKQQLKKPNGCIMAVYVLSQQQGIQSWCHLQPGCQPGPNNFYRVGGQCICSAPKKWCLYLLRALILNRGQFTLFIEGLSVTELPVLKRE